MTSPQRLADALRGVLKIIEDGDLVRNLGRDDEVMNFVEQGKRIIKALQEAQDALEQYQELTKCTTQTPQKPSLP